MFHHHLTFGFSFPTNTYLCGYHIQFLRYGSECALEKMLTLENTYCQKNHYRHTKMSFFSISVSLIGISVPKSFRKIVGRHCRHRNGKNEPLYYTVLYG